jgi:hypothetical protein
MQRLLLAGQYDSLDGIARDLRGQRTRWPNGLWKLRSFYEFGFNEPAHDSSETEWKALLGHLREWAQTRPTSITARVALAQTLVGYAWHGRGSGYAHETSDIQNRLFQDRLRQAASVVQATQGLSEYCPGLPAVALRVALGLRWDRRTYDSIYDKAIEREPSYEFYYEHKAFYLLPRWYGEQGEWERYAEQAAIRLGGSEGDAMYARIVWSLEDYYPNSMFKESSASWERTARGYQHLIHTSPHSLELQSEFAKLATQAADQEQARAMFVRIGSRIDPYVWATREIFVNVRAWALQ